MLESAKSAETAPIAERFIRNLGALTEEEQRLLGEKRVFIAGCGGLGGYLLELLLRLGVRRIVLADGDVFEASNLNRQLLATPALLGTAKAKAAKARAAAIAPEAEVVAHEVFLTADKAACLLAGCDAALDALDNIESRRLLAEACAAVGIPLIHGAIHGWTAQVALCLPGDRLMDRLYPKGATLADKASLAFTPPFCAAMQTALCVRLLCDREVPAGRLWFVDLLDMEMTGIF